MKKISILLMAILVVAVLAGCSCSTSTSNSTSNQSATNTSNATNTANASDLANKFAGKKVLVAYFSPANNNTNDAVSSATPMIDGKSSVEYLASLIGNKTGATLAPIVTKNTYPTSYNDTADKAKNERDNKERPEFTINANPEEYDVIFVGYPIWWYEMPMVMDTFFEKYNFDGKTIIPFNTHEGSKDGGTYDDIKKLEPNATVLDGFNVSGGDTKDAEKDLTDWLNKLTV